MVMKGRSFLLRASMTLVVAIGALTLAASSAAGQGTAPASIIGRVTDGTGAVLPGVTVTATSPALQVSQVTAVTDSEGEYRLSALPIGGYQVTWELSGFQGGRPADARVTCALVGGI